MICRDNTDALQGTDWYDDTSALPNDWDELLPPNHYLSRASLEYNSDIQLPDIEYYYVSLRKNGKLKALVAFQVLSLRPYHLNTTTLSSAYKKIWLLFIRIGNPRLLVAGNLFRHDVASVFYDQEWGSFQVFDWYLLVLDRLRERCKAQAVLVKDVPDPLVDYFHHNAPKYLLLRNDISMKMAIPQEWSSLKDYEAELKHKYAQRFRKARKVWQQLQVRELDAEEVGTYSKSIFELYSQVAQHQPLSLGLLNASYLPVLKKQASDALCVWGIFEKDQMIAFASAWQSASRLDMFYIGFNYELKDSYQLYFNILFFALDQAISRGKSELVLGRTALEAKARLGCKPEYLNTFLLVKSPLVTYLLSRVQQRLGTKGQEWERRHPFKA
ncbi:MAG: hypothetical protein JST36_02655 [Bacteroidetes bacterium]|nr:hypothetical protein [Bacteroidota bacterium]